MIDNIFFFGDADDVAGSSHVSNNVADVTGGTQAKDPFGNSINIPPAAGKLYFNVRVTTVIGAGALTLDLITGSSATITSAMVNICRLTIPSATTVGSTFSVGIHPASHAWDRYVGVLIDASSAAVTGNVDMWLGLNPVSEHTLPR